MASFIQILTFISTILFYLSPYFWLAQLRLKKIEINETSCFVVIFALINSTLSSIIIKLEENNSILYWSNLIGIISCFIWLLIYLYISTEAKKNIQKYLIFIFAIVDLVIEIYYIETDILNPDKGNQESEFEYIERKKYRKDLALLITGIFNILMYISPGFNLFKFISECNQRYICLPMEITGFVNSILYFVMECLLDDKKYYLLILNVMNIIICLFFSVFYLVNLNKKMKPKLEPFIKENVEQKGPTKKEIPKKKTMKKRKYSKSKQQEEVLEFL